MFVAFVKFVVPSLLCRFFMESLIFIRFVRRVVVCTFVVSSFVLPTRWVVSVVTFACDAVSVIALRRVFVFVLPFGESVIASSFLRSFGRINSLLSISFSRRGFVMVRPV